MSTYTVDFDRIGRTHNVRTLVTDANDLDGLAEAIHGYARPMLLSRDVEVVVEAEQDGTVKGAIFCGWHTGGTFTATRSEQREPA